MEPVKYDEILTTLIQGDMAYKWADEHTGWTTSDKSVCNWDGVTCDPIDSSITEIDLSMAGIQGTIPTVLGLLFNLRKLNLYHNQFVGTIPSEVLALPQLIQVNLGLNLIDGSFPLFLSPTVESLEVPENKFTGTLHEDIALAYPGLIYLNLSHNGFTGTMPQSIVEASNLQILDLSFNSIHGVIPHEIGRLKGLKRIFLNENRFYGPIPPSFRDIPYLEQLSLQHNELSGTIPGPLSEIRSLKDFFVDGNKLTGAVPMELCHHSLNNLYFNSIPGAEQRDGCDSVSCALNYKSERGMYPCEACPAGKFTPYLGWNGQCILVEERNILDALYAETKGTEWINADRWGNSNVPHCMYEGIDCNEDGQVVGITLTGMNLQGSIPDKIGRLPHLRSLKLDGNKLTGFVPPDLRFPPLETLDLSDNELVGPLPPLLCQKPFVNGNGANGVLSCDVIMCPKGSWYSGGRVDAPGRRCIPCPDIDFLGQTRCNSIAMASMGQAGDYITTHIWPMASLVFAACFVAALALHMYWSLRRKVEKNVDEKARITQEDYFTEDGVYDPNAFDQEQEELNEVSYHQDDEEQAAQLPIDEPLPTTPPNIRSRRSASPDDDPDTQDLWLDVPKIA